MDALVLPSLFEGFPLVAVEAQTAGLPCYLSDAITKASALTGSCALYQYTQITHRVGVRNEPDITLAEIFQA